MLPDNKLYTRTVKLIITAAIALAVIAVTSWLTYGGVEVWETAIARIWHKPTGFIVFFVFASIFIYDILSIIAFKLGWERQSDEFQWYAKGSEYKIPRAWKIWQYPFALLICFFFLYASL